MKITGAAAVLPVSDLDASLRFFKDVLGFAEEFRFNKYAGIVRDDMLLHLSHFGNPNTSVPGSGTVYIFCDEVDGYYSEITARGAVADGPPTEYPYGMKDFVVFDPDRNRISFGCPVPVK